MKRYCLLVFLFLHIAFSFAGNVKLTGVSNMPATLIRVQLPADPVSGKYVTVATSKTDFKGSFTLQFEATDIVYSKIAIGRHQNELLIKPNASYHIQLIVQENEQTSFYDAPAMRIEIIEANDQGLLHSIENINLIYNAFVMEHFQSVHRLGRTAYLDTLQTTIQASIAGIGENFVKEYSYYKLATLEPLIKKMTIRQLYELFFKNKPIQYNNPEYLSLFSNFFSSYFLESSLNGQNKFLEALTNGKLAVIAFAAEDPLIGQDKAFTELVVLFHLKTLFFHPALPDKAVENILLEIAASTQIYEHRSIANNIVSERTRLSVGASAPSIKLKDTYGKIQQLSDFSDKLVLLNFLKENCPLCEHELSLLRNINSKYEGQVWLISIATKESFQYYSHLFETKRYNWILLDLDQNFSLLEDYSIKVFPENILLMKEGRIGMAPAPTQEEALDHHIRRLLESD